MPKGMLEREKSLLGGIWSHDLSAMVEIDARKVWRGRNADRISDLLKICGLNEGDVAGRLGASFNNVER
jgi:hypothetical protein